MTSSQSRDAEMDTQARAAASYRRFEARAEAHYSTGLTHGIDWIKPPQEDFSIPPWCEETAQERQEAWAKAEAAWEAEEARMHAESEHARRRCTPLPRVMQPWLD